jgi:N-acetyl-anhydromuramoyl-L-alanine amidase
MYPEWALSATGWLEGKHLRHKPSPNFNTRPHNIAIDTLVVHNISLPPGDFSNTEDIEALFTNTLDNTRHPFYKELIGLEVSAHFIIHRTGELVQCVSIWDRAWHAGRSFLGERSGCNDFSIGIELVGDDKTPFTSAQYETLFACFFHLKTVLPLTAIVGHSDIAPGRKTDPGPCFEWAYLSQKLSISNDFFPFGLASR